MNALTAIRVLGPLALVLSPLALQAGPGNKTMRVYSARMETLFIRLDLNRDGRLDASEVQGRRALSRRLKRQNNRSYLLLDDLRPQGASPSGPRLKHHFRQADRDFDRRLDRQEAKRIRGTMEELRVSAMESREKMLTVNLKQLIWRNATVLTELHDQ